MLSDKRKFIYIHIDNHTEPVIGLAAEFIQKTFFDFVPEEYEHDINNPDFIFLDGMAILKSYRDKIFETKVFDVVRKFPRLPILIHLCTCPVNGINMIGDNLDQKPVFLEDNHWAVLHYTTMFNFPNWATSDNFLYYDIRFDHYRYYTIGGCPTPAPFEHLNFLWRRPSIDDSVQSKARKFLIPNRVKPKTQELGGRYYLDQVCRELNYTDMFTGNHYHVLISGQHSDAHSWYNNQNNSNRLIGCIEDPTVDNFKIWNPVTNEISKTINYNDRLNSVHDVNNFPHSYYYEQSYCSVYSETTESNDPLPSEKTWHALGRGHFILPLSGAGFINLLKNLNFKFPEFIDYSYDSIQDGPARRDAWLEEFQRLHKIPIEIWQQHFIDNLKLLQWNAKNFYVYPVQNPYLKFFKDVKKYENQVQ